MAKLKIKVTKINKTLTKNQDIDNPKTINRITQGNKARLMFLTHAESCATLHQTSVDGFAKYIYT